MSPPRRLPLHDRHQLAGARLVEVDGWLVPGDFGDPRAEYAALRRGAAVLDLSMRGALRLDGSERAAFLHNMVTNDILGLRPGQGAHAAKLDVHGKMEAAVHVLCLPEALLCDVDPGPAAAVHAALERHRILEDTRILDVASERALLAVQGPEAARLLAAAGVRAVLPGEDLAHVETRAGAAEVRVVRRDHAGGGGFDLWVPVADAAGLWGALVDVGARPTGLEALDVRRIEAGVPWSGTEITGEYFPIEAGLETGWISYTKGCYLGQETIARLHHLGHVNRRLRGLLVEGEAAPRRGAGLHAGGKRCGVVTSAAFSPQLGRPVGLAYVHREFAEPGTVVGLDEDGGRRAEVSALPLA